MCRGYWVILIVIILIIKNNNNNNDNNNSNNDNNNKGMKVKLTVPSYLSCSNSQHGESGSHQKWYKHTNARGTTIYAGTTGSLIKHASPYRLNISPSMPGATTCTGRTFHAAVPQICRSNLTCFFSAFNKLHVKYIIKKLSPYGLLYSSIFFT